jgi:glycine cleavage system H protein
MMELLIGFMFLVFVACLGAVLAGQVYLAAGSLRSRMPALSWIGRGRLAEGIRYHHPGHTWAQALAKGVAAVGIDELGSKILGRIDAVGLPQVGQEVRQGKRAWSFRLGARTVHLVSPVTGRVLAVNGRLEREPSLINRAPYGQGWVFKARLSRTSEDLKSLFGGPAARRLMELTRAWVGLILSPPASLQPTFQDGGEIVEGLAHRLTDEQWERLKREIFLSD